MWPPGTMGVTANVAKWDISAKLDISQAVSFPFGPLPCHPVHSSKDPEA